MDIYAFTEQQKFINQEISLRNEMNDAKMKGDVNKYHNLAQSMYNTTYNVQQVTERSADVLDSIPAIKEYKQFVFPLLQRSFSNLTIQTINDALNYSILKRMKNGKAAIDNNYKNKTINSTVLNICNYIIEREPIITAAGVMFKRHGTTPNPLEEVITEFLDARTIYKKEMLKHPKGSEQYEKYNLLQLLAKIDANGLYGAMGNKSCILYNLYVASSITAQGRACISTAGTFFEAFLANNVKFIDLDEIVTFIHNVCDLETRRYNDIFILDRNISIEEVFNKLILTCDITKYIPTEDDLLIVWELLNNVSQVDLNRLYYKNNLYEFMENRYSLNMYVTIMQTLQSPFLDPNEPNDEIKEQLDDFCDLLKEWVYYPHIFIDKQQRYSSMIRSVCILTDTDSTLISLDAWYRFSLEKLRNVDMNIRTQVTDAHDFILNGSDTKIVDTIEKTDIDYNFVDDEVVEVKKYAEPFIIIPQENIRYSVINILAYCLYNIVNDYMELFTINAIAVRVDKKCLLIMKNEFLFKRVLLEASNKKRYATIQELQEGNKVPEEKELDIKGMDIRKSTINPYTRSRMEKIIHEDILKADNIDLVHILKQLAIFENDIFNSLRSGEKLYCKPIKVKSIKAYDDPMRVVGIKQSIVWNALKDDDTPIIDLEQINNLDILKLNINKHNIEDLKIKNEYAYNKVINLMSSNKYFEKGIDSIAIPKDQTFPDWMIDYIDYTTVINNNLSVFPLESLRIYRGNNSNNYTNIISL